ncbi:hypothetical protein D4R20_02790, partial [bacterium]
YSIESKKFLEPFYYYVLVRLIQTFGSYAYSFSGGKKDMIIKMLGNIKKLEQISDCFAEKDIRTFITTLSNTRDAIRTLKHQ